MCLWISLHQMHQPTSCVSLCSQMVYNVCPKCLYSGLPHAVARVVVGGCREGDELGILIDRVRGDTDGGEELALTHLVLGPQRVAQQVLVRRDDGVLQRIPVERRGGRGSEGRKEEGGGRRAGEGRGERYDTF